MSSSAGTINADVNITINAEDRATVQVESAARKINRQWREMRIEQRAVQQQFELSNTKFIATTRVLNQVGNVIGRVQSAYNTYQLAQIRVQDATRNTADATRNLSDAIVEFGLSSPEAIAAAERRAEALENEKRATNDALIGYVTIAAFLGTTLLGRTAAIIGSFKTLNAVLRGTPKGLGPTSGIAASTAGSAAAKTAAGIGGRIAGKALPFGLGFLLAAGNIPTAGGDLGSGVIGGEKQNDPIDDFLFQHISKPLGEAGREVVQTIINIFASTPQEIVEEIASAQERATRFTGQ